MSEEEHSIQVNFGKAVPLFPLDNVTLLPQQVLPLHIFEPRYRQMVQRALDGAGQIAMAVFEGKRWQQEYHGRPPIRPAVCIGQIVQHEKTLDGRYNVLLQGVCRARIVEELPPDGERLYRMAILEPVGVDAVDEQMLASTRHKLDQALSEGPLTHMAAAQPVLEYVRNEEIPTAAILEVVSFTLVTDSRTRYRLLAEGDALRRAEIIETALGSLAELLARATRQIPGDLPKGCNWN
jgi:Lon protease-like protein